MTDASASSAAEGRHKEKNPPAACIACGGTRFRALDADDTFHKARFTVYRCESCGLGALHPIPDFASLEKTYYNEDYHAYQSAGAEGGFLRDTKDGIKKAVLATYFGYGTPSLKGRLLHPFFFRMLTYPRRRDHGVYLDVGCGSGVKMMHMRDLGWDVWGVDLSKLALSIAQRNGLTNLSHGTLHDAHFPAGQFDVVNMTHVLEHLENPDAILGEIHRILKDGGEVIIAVPNFEGLGYRIFQGAADYDIPRHFYQYTLQSLTMILERNGFKVRESYRNDIMRGVGHSLHFALHLPESMGKYFVMAGAAADLCIESFLSQTSLGSQLIVKAVKKN